MTALELITRALRLINVPGRGAALSADDTESAFEALQDLLNSAAVSKQFVPGIRRHFFPLQSGKAIYSYGPGGDFDTDDFDDPVPVRIEDGFIRVGGAIVDNEQVQSHEFATATGWSPAGGWTIANGVAAAAGVGTLEQTLALVAGTAYTLRVSVTIRDGDVNLVVNQDGTAIVDQDLDISGDYTFELAFTGAASEIVLTTDDADDDLDIESVSILPADTDRYELGSGRGDHPIKLIDQRGYNREFTKGHAGRPYRILFERTYPLAFVRCDHAASGGEILVLDALVNRIGVEELASEVRLHPDAIEYVKYALADRQAGEYGKALTRGQTRIMDDAYNRLAAGNRRMNALRVDRGLRRGRRFDIDRGDP